jgi:hypothetical protein
MSPEIIRPHEGAPTRRFKTDVAIGGVPYRFLSSEITLYANVMVTILTSGQLEKLLRGQHPDASGPEIRKRCIDVSVRFREALDRGETSFRDPQAPVSVSFEEVPVSAVSRPVAA